MTQIQQEDNPWTILHTEQVFESPWIRVVKHDVINPGNQPGIYAVTHFKNIALGILPLDEDLNTWIVGQYRFPINAYSWEIPEGGGALDIDPIDSAKRELKEETGIVAGEWELIQQLHTSNSATDEVAYIYIARNLTFEEAEPEPSEQLQIKKIHLNELYRLVQEGEITDSLTVAAVLKAKILLLEGKLK